MSDLTGLETLSAEQTARTLAASFGAKMEVGLQLRATTTDIELTKARARVRGMVKGCQKCELSQKCAGPVAMTGPETGGAAKVVVVGEAPGKVENEKGRPFVGPAGKLMRALMTTAGFDLDEVSWCNVVSCWPHREPPTPNRQEMIDCRGNLRDQVVASGALYVVLAGGIATQAWRGDLKVSDVHGRCFIWGGMWVVMPVYHPAAILRDQTKKKPTMTDLEKFARVVNGDEGLGALEVRCVKCGEDVDHYDPDGVAFCNRHWLKYGAQWKVEMLKWSNNRGVVKVKRGYGKKATVLREGQGELV